MKRILVGLIGLSLAIGLMVGCQLNAPDAAVDQTQVDSVLLTVSEDGAFGQSLTRTVGTGDVIDGWEFGAATKTTLTFDTDGTWEIKLEWYEAAAKTESDSTQTAEDHNGNGTEGEGWVQTAGKKGTYAYDAETYVLTMYYNGEIWENGATPAYDSVWNATDNLPAVPNQLMASKSFVMKDFSVDDDGYANIIQAGEIAVSDENNICTDLLDVFDTDDDDGYDYINADGQRQTVTKVWANTDTAAPDYTITTVTHNFAISDTEITYYRDGIQKTEPYSGTASYTNPGSTAKWVYALDLESTDSFADGILLSVGEEKSYKTKTYAVDSFDTTTGVVTRDTTYTVSYSEEAPGAGVASWLQAWGDGYLAY